VEADLRIETYAADAAEWVSKLRHDPRFSSVVILGHSEGALVGMLAAKMAPPDAFVSIAGPGRPAGDLLLEQLKPKLTSEVYEGAAATVRALAAGKTVEDVPSALRSLFRRSVQPYLISWFAYDPAKVISKLEVPILILQGTTDVQVSVEDAERLARSAPGARMRTFPGMNHVLKAADSADAQMRAYADPRVPVVEALLDEVSRFALEPAARPAESD